MKRTYSELITLPTFEERYAYLKLDNIVGDSTFGYARYLNRKFYSSNEWRQIRKHIIVRDLGCDMALEDRPIPIFPTIHHINPITKDDIIHATRLLLDPENLILVSKETHQAIHFYDAMGMPSLPDVRSPGDTKLW